MDHLERHEYEATRATLKAILGIEGNSGLNNAELAGRVRDLIERERKRFEDMDRATIECVECGVDFTDDGSGSTVCYGCHWGEDDEPDDD